MTWHKEGKGQVRRSYYQQGKIHTQSLAEFITGEKAPKGYVWGRVDRDWHNFYRENLRLEERGLVLYSDAEKRKEWSSLGASKGGRNGGTPNANGFRGVHKIGENYRALARVDGKQKYLGSAKTAEGAAKLYDEALIAQGLPPVNFPHGGADRAEEIALERKQKEARLRLLETEIAQLRAELAEP